MEVLQLIQWQRPESAADAIKLMASSNIIGPVWEWEIFLILHSIQLFYIQYMILRSYFYFEASFKSKT
jgi:hypothetical protein